MTRYKNLFLKARILGFFARLMGVDCYVVPKGSYPSKCYRKHAS